MAESSNLSLVALMLKSVRMAVLQLALRFMKTIDLVTRHLTVEMSSNPIFRDVAQSRRAQWCLSEAGEGAGRDPMFA